MYAGGNAVDATTPDVLSCDVMEGVWMSWEDGIIRVGMSEFLKHITCDVSHGTSAVYMYYIHVFSVLLGEFVGDREIMQYVDPNYHDVNAIAISGYENEADFYFYNDCELNVKKNLYSFTSNIDFVHVYIHVHVRRLR